MHIRLPRSALAACLALAAATVAEASNAAQAEPEAPLSAMVPIAAGSFVPLYGAAGRPLQVAAFELDVRAVTNAEFFRFVTTDPTWQRDRVAPLFADPDYLSHWQAPLRLGPLAPLASPVTNVSWFAARAFCAAHGKRLPTLAEWEFAARASEARYDATQDPVFLERILGWYAARTQLPLPGVRSTFQNRWGVWDLHGLVWEWVQDFNSVLLSGGSRVDAAGPDPQLFCAAGAIGSTRTGDYAAFMRYALRASTRARHALQSLGFRCARGIAS